jgi:hypothetical protein
MYQCDDCNETFSGIPAKDAYTSQGQNYGVCPNCAKTQSDGLIRTVARLAKSEFCYGGYPMAFYPPDGGCVLCFDCAKSDLENGDNLVRAECEDSDSRYYGGIHCDGCNAEIVAACCPECGDELADKKRLFAENVDASQLCFDCAVRLVRHHYLAIKNEPWEHPMDMRGPHAIRIPGIGIEIVPTPEHVRSGAWDDGTPWYASSGTIYRYR